MRRGQKRKSRKRSNYKTYDYSNLVAAYNHCKDHNTPVKVAAKLFGVPSTTLNDRVIGKVSIDPDEVAKEKAKRREEKKVKRLSQKTKKYDEKLIRPIVSKLKPIRPYPSTSAVESSNDSSIISQVGEKDSSVIEDDGSVISVDGEDADKNTETAEVSEAEVEMDVMPSTSRSSNSESSIVTETQNIQPSSGDQLTPLPQDNVEPQPTSSYFMTTDTTSETGNQADTEEDKDSFMPVITSVTSLQQTLLKPKTGYKNYSKEDMVAACQAVRAKEYTVREAAHYFGVPSSTLREKIHQGFGKAEDGEHVEIIKKKVKIDFPESFSNDTYMSDSSSQDKFKYPDGAHKKYKQYTRESLQKAAKIIKESNISVTKAAKIFGIPKSTLKGKMKNMRNSPEAIKKEMYFPTEDCVKLPAVEERKVVDYIGLMGYFGYFLGRDKVCSFAKQLDVSNVAEQVLTSNPKVSKWFNDFSFRYRSVSIDGSRSYTSVHVKNYFLELQKIMAKHSLFNKPELIYMIDEIGIDVESSPEMESPRLAIYKSNQIPQNSGYMYSLVGCGNALGTALPPFFIFSGHTFSSDLIVNSPPGTQGIPHLQEVTRISFLRQYICKHFLRFVQMGTAHQGVILLYNGHSTSISLDDIEWAKRNKIFLYVLPPHKYKNEVKHSVCPTIDPFDVGLFEDFEMFAKIECQEFTKSGSEKVSIKNVAAIAGRAYHRCLTWECLSNNFKKSGIYPYCPAKYISQLTPDMQMDLYGFKFPDPTGETTETQTANSVMGITSNDAKPKSCLEQALQSPIIRKNFIPIPNSYSTTVFSRSKDTSYQEIVVTPQGTTYHRGPPAFSQKQSPIHNTQNVVIKQELPSSEEKPRHRRKPSNPHRVIQSLKLEDGSSTVGSLESSQPAFNEELNDGSESNTHSSESQDTDDSHDDQGEHVMTVDGFMVIKVEEESDEEN